MKKCLIAAVLILALAACQVPGVKEVEEKVNSMSGQVSQLRTAGQDLGERLEDLEARLSGIQIPGTGDTELPDFGSLFQGVTAEVEAVRMEILEELNADREEIDSLRAVIEGLEEELEALSARITTIENRPTGGTTYSGSTGTTGRGDTTGGRGGTTGGR
jgi:BMFP domain-containing protein YqiC